MVTLEAAKNYLKVDADITEDDDLITSLISAAEGYIEQCTGKRNDDNDTYDLTIKLLVAHWYENRQTYNPKPGTLSELPHSITALIRHIASAQAYPALEETTP